MRVCANIRRVLNTSVKNGHRGEIVVVTGNGRMNHIVIPDPTTRRTRFPFRDDSFSDSRSKYTTQHNTTHSRKFDRVLLAWDPNTPPRRSERQRYIFIVVLLTQ